MKRFAIAALALSVAASASRADIVTYAFHPVNNPGSTLGEITFSGPTISATTPWDIAAAAIPGPVVTDLWFDLTSISGPVLTLANIHPDSHVNAISSSGPLLSGAGSPSDMVAFSTLGHEVWFSVDSAGPGSDGAFIFGHPAQAIIGDWVVVVPAPGAAGLFGLAGLALLRRSR